MSRGRPTASSTKKFLTVSFFGQLALAGAVMVYIFSTTFGPAEINNFFVMLFILIFGIVLSYTMVGVKFIAFSAKSLFSDLVATLASFITVWYVNKIVPAEIGISPIGETAFGILSGVSEEWMFRAWLCSWIYKMTGSMLLAVPISSFAWAIFHLARYGGNMDLIWLVFFAGLPLGYFTLAFRSADGPTFGHMIVNAFARR